MSEFLVTGIAPTADPAQVAQQLAGCKLDEARLSTISKSSTQARMHEEHTGAPSLSNSSTIMTGAGGTGVPGISASRASLSSLSAYEDVPDYLGGLPLIPPDRAENYNIAIAEGRTLVMYKATPEEAPQIETAFRAAGLRNVKIFK
jgi:hypothetical protein